MILVKDYMKDDDYRHMLNELTEKVFGFNFEDWVNNNYFEGDYIPYSYIENNQMVSNVSVNKMTFSLNGIIKNYIQIGTVMTDMNYRGKGLAKSLMEHTIKEYKNKCDGIYLFGDLSAIDFYKKLGFKVINQYRYSIKQEYLDLKKENEFFKPIQDMNSNIKLKYLKYVKESINHSSFEQINKYGLTMFYTSSFDNVYYLEKLDSFIVLEKEDSYVLKMILSKDKISLVDILKHIDIDFSELRLGFTPLNCDMDKVVTNLYDGGEDYRLFYMGDDLKIIEEEKLYFPDLSHA